MTLEKDHKTIGVVMFMNKDKAVVDVSLKSIKGKMVFGKGIALKRSGRARLAGCDDDLARAGVIGGRKGISRVITPADSGLNRL